MLGSNSTIIRINPTIIYKAGIKNMIMITFSSLGCFVIFMKNSPKKKGNNHPKV